MITNLNQLKAELTEAGFRPAPFQWVLWNIRKLLWPVFRQYHYYHLERLTESQAESASIRHELLSLRTALDSMNEGLLELRSGCSTKSNILSSRMAELKELTDRNDGVLRSKLDISTFETLERRFHEQHDELLKANLAQLEFRTDVAALVNRQSRQTVEANERFRDVDGRLSEAFRLIDSLLAERMEFRLDLAAVARSVELQASATAKAEQHLGVVDGELKTLSTQTSILVDEHAAATLLANRLATAQDTIALRIDNILREAEDADRCLRTDIQVVKNGLARAEDAISEMRRHIENLTDTSRQVVADQVAKLAMANARNQEITEELHRYATRYAELRGELATLWTRQRKFTAQLHKAGATQLDFTRQLTHLLTRLQEHDAAVSRLLSAGDAITDEIRELQRRTGLALVSAQSGILLVKPGDLISDSLRISGVWDPHVHQAIVDWSTLSNGTAIDVGANIGSTTITMARCFKKVYSFEPNQFAFRLLQANVSLNNLSHVECINAALSSRVSTQSLARLECQEIEVPLNERAEFDGLRASNLGAYSFAEDGTDICTVESKTLDSYRFNDVTLIKIDAQGADGEVILGALETIRQWRPCIIFEWERYLAANYSATLAQVREVLARMNYDLHVLKQTNEKQVDYIARPRPMATAAAG